MKQKLFNVTVVYEKTADEGKVVKATENYILEAINFTDAENRITSEMEYCISGEFNVKNLRRANFVEILHTTGTASGVFYKVSCSFISFDEDKLIETDTKRSYLVYAETLLDAHSKMVEFNKATMADYVIRSIAETKIIDFFPCPDAEAEANTDVCEEEQQ